MGLSIAISGGIILTVFVLILLSLPGFMDKMFSIGDISSQVSEFDLKIANTDISLETLFATSGSSYVNFTLNNDDREKLWNFEKFNVIVEYESASGDALEELSFSGDCLGVLPAVGNWCIEQIAGDFLDKGILNDGESAKVWTRVSQNLVNGNARVTVNTDNGIVAKLPAPKRSWFDVGPIPPVKCEFENYGRTYVDTDTGNSFLCDPVRDKWLSTETQSLFGDETGNCDPGQNPNSDGDCNVDWGNGLGPDVSSSLGLYIPYNMTLVAYGFSQDIDDCTSGSFDVEIWSTGSSTDDDNYTLEQEIATGLTGQLDNNNDMNIDINGNQYILWGLENNCGQIIDDFNIIIYFKWRHDQP